MSDAADELGERIARIRRHDPAAARSLDHQWLDAHEANSGADDDRVYQRRVDELLQLARTLDVDGPASV